MNEEIEIIENCLGCIYQTDLETGCKLDSEENRHCFGYDHYTAQSDIQLLNNWEK